LAERNRQFKQK